MPSSGESSSSSQYQLRFRSLFREGRAYAFPCDVEGHVDIDLLSERARDNYFFARISIGRELSIPEVCRCDSLAPAGPRQHFAEGAQVHA
ncbi:hypothetical protein QTI66_02690 [Variovorax sp. J22R133]|nr:hypothetical protein [Variovorax sp. J22R133]MDM0111035.1 hypothetical protein [Variovorax sp. J22R133]